jgi:ubiquinone/menaquinone biosynthesis C-methylase UbiE
VLDLATGTGIWAIEFAEQFPSAHVIGTDLSPIQPAYVPPNCHFVVDDAEDPWLFSHEFDYIHGRMLVTCFQSHLEVFRSAFDNLRPGGYLGKTGSRGSVPSFLLLPEFCSLFSCYIKFISYLCVDIAGFSGHFHILP